MSESLPQILERVRARTPARLLAGRTGGSYRTVTQLQLRTAHAAARDAVRGELDLGKHLGDELVERLAIFEVTSRASSKDQYLLRPDLGRRLSEQAQNQIGSRCGVEADLQIIVGDGLSTAAVAAQVPGLLPRLIDGAKQRGWKIGQPFAVRFCRVGLLNEIGDLLKPRVAVLLIGERPGLATAESLSAYMAFRPGSGQTDADRNLISNIHGRGIGHQEAASRILNLAEKMMFLKMSGVAVREELPGRVPAPLQT